MSGLPSVILALARKDLRLLWRDRVGFFFVFGFPLLIAVFFGLVFSGPSGGSSSPLPVAIVDLDASPLSRRLVETLGASEAIEAETHDAVEPARARVQAGRRVASIEIEPGFGATPLAARLSAGDPRSLAGITLAIDPSRQAEAGLLRGVVTREAFAALAPEGAGGSPIPVRVTPIQGGSRNAFLVTFPQGLVWGVMACAAGFGISLVGERRSGTLDRVRCGPTPAWTLLAGKAVACFAGNVSLALVLLVVGAVWFGLLASASLGALAMAVLSVALCFVGLMMLLAVAGRSEAAAGGVGWAVLLVLAMVGGAMAPRLLMPPWLDAVGSLSPVRWSIDAYEGAIWRGWTLTQMLAPCAKLIGLGVAAFVLGAGVMARRG